MKNPYRQNMNPNNLNDLENQENKLSYPQNQNMENLPGQNKYIPNESSNQFIPNKRQLPNSENLNPKTLNIKGPKEEYNKKSRSRSPKLNNRKEVNLFYKLKSNRGSSGGREKKRDNIIYYPDGTCWACDVGCSVSTTGYSPMNFSPYNNIRRRDVTPVKPGTKYEQYTRHKKEKK